MDNQTNATDVPAMHLVPFHGDTLATLEHEGTRYVVMVRVVKNLGMSWASQTVKLRSQQAKFNSFDIETLGSDGKRREMLCIPIERLQIWLAGINANKVRADLREKVERYQAESAIALHDYWTKGFASRDGSAEQMAGLRRDMDRLMSVVSGLIIMHDDRRAVIDMVSVLKILDKANVPQKGRNKLNRKFQYELRKRSLFLTGRGEPAPHREDANTGVLVYKPDFMEDFLREKGRGWIADHMAKVMGQGVIPFPKAIRPKPADGKGTPAGR